MTLHSYRYAWAERAKSAGYPERFAQQALGHNSKAFHRAYACHAHVIIPSLGEHEKQAEAQRVIPFPAAVVPGPDAESGMATPKV
ncbi:MAG: hypothetical protein ACKPGI_04565 [Verrucomicrobiota bacterium]